MYTDDEERKGLPIKTFLISLILIIVLVLLLVWLLPMPNLKGLNNRIFNSNIQEMKNAAIPYFTTDKLPQEIGDSKTLTLQEMIDLKLLLPFTDKNGDKCDTEKSYVTLTKRGTEDDSYYELKVYLKCNDDEDYILVTLGCYSYCTSAICEPEKEDKPSNPNKPNGGNSNKPIVSTGPSCVLYIASGTKGSNGWYLNNPVVKFKSKSTSTNGASIVKYGLSTGSVQYNGNDSFTVTKEGSTTVYGYVKDSNGKTATCSITVEKRNNIEYQYKKDFSRQYSAWGAWTTYTYSKNNPPRFGKYELIEMEDLGKSQEVDYYQYTKGDPIYVKDTVKVGTINQTYCTGYKYYRTTVNNTTTTYAVSESDDWVFEGRYTTTGVPTNTLAVKYELVGLDWSSCGTGCTRAPKKIWNKYSRRVYKATSTNTVTTLSGISTPCGSTATRQVEIFATVDKLVGYEEVRTPVYKDVYRYRRRTRTVTQEAYTDYKWSTYNDTKLLNQGYTMTGNTRVVD